MLFKTKMAAFLAASALVLVVPVAMGTVPAQASVQAHASVTAPQVPAAYGATICSGDVCIQSHCGGCLEQPIAEWLSTTTYVGHFETIWGCSIAGCNVYNSSNQRWYAGGQAYISPDVPYGVSVNVIFWAGPYSSGERWRAKGDVGFNTAY